jgi:PAS domain S-box-containing protein
MSYKTKMLSIYIITIFIILVLSFNLLNSFSNVNVGNISHTNLKFKSLERKEYFNTFFKPYKTTIKSLNQSKILSDYLSGKLDKTLIQNYFMDIQKSLPHISQIRYIDNNGQEIIKILKNSQVVPNNKLQNKINRNYMKQFLNLKNNDLGISDINLNKENGKLELPKNIVVRFAINVFDNNKIKKGIVVLNISLNKFLEKMSKATIYNLYLIDKNGQFIMHGDKNLSILGDNNFVLKDQFPDYVDNILKKDEFISDHLYSIKINNFNNQNIKIIIEDKFSNEIKKANEIEAAVITISILFAIILLPITIYFARQPDLLKERLRDKDKIEKQKLFIETLLKNLPIPMFYKDNKGIYFDVNEKFLDFFGIEYEDIIGYTIKDIAHQKFVNKYKEMDKKLLNGNQDTQTYQSSIINIKTSSTKDVVFYKNILYDKNQNKIGIIGSILDISDINKYKKELESANENLNQKVKEQTEQLVDKINVIDKYLLFSETNTKGIITNVSEAFCQKTGYSKYELIGNPHNIIRHPDTPKDIFEDMWDKLKEGKAWKGEFQNLTKDGIGYWIYCDIQPKYDNNKNIVGYISIISDITNKKMYEQQQSKLLEQSKLAAMGSMIGNIAHQWRQPLSIISTIASGIEFKYKLGKFDNEQTRKDMKFIVDETKRLSETIETFRNFLKEKKEYKEVILQDRIDIALKISSVTLKDNGIKLINNVDYKKPIKVNLVIGEIVEVFINIINNAKDILIEKKIEHPWVTIQTYTKENTATVTIEDNGGGIPNNIIDKIFDEYFTTKDDSNGTGLGLHMSKQIICDSHKGNMYVQNSDNGAKFFIELPMS